MLNSKGDDMAKTKTSKKTVVKKTAAKTTAKKTTAKKKPVKKAGGMKEGSRYACSVCGLAVTVDTECGCGEAAHLICCETPMRKKK